MNNDREAMLEIREAILRERRKRREASDKRPGEFTAKKYALDNGISTRSARRDLDLACHEGFVKKRESDVGNVIYYSYLKEE